MKSNKVIHHTGRDGNVFSDVETEIENLRSSVTILQGKAVVAPSDYGCFGDGATDDAAGMQDALDAAEGRILDLQGLTYRIDSTLTIPSNVIIRNGTLDFSTALGTLGVGLLAQGSIGTADSTATSIAYADRVINTSQASSYAVDEHIIIRSQDIWSTDSSERRGQWGKVKRIVSASRIELYGSSYDAYATTIRVYRPTLVENITLDNVDIIGRGDGYSQFGAQFKFARNVKVRNCRFLHWAYAACEFYTCADISVFASEAAHGDDATGASYGFAFYSGCERFAVTDSFGEDLRHFFTIGGIEGVSRFGTVKGNACRAMTDSFLDAHPAAEFIVFDGNVGEHETNFDGDGIVYQGANGVITGNTVVSANTAGILVQPFAYHTRNSIVIANNIINRIETSTGYGILLDVRQRIDGLTISGNVIHSPVAFGISINAQAADIFHTVISGNSVFNATAQALYLNAVGSQFILRTAVTGNIFARTTTTGPCVECTAATESNLQYVAFTGNSIHGGSYGIQVDAETERVLAVGNIFNGQSTGTTLTTGVSVTQITANITT